jgi:hypothetical protein
MPTASLAPGTKYFWHVSASNSVGESPLSAIWTFITSGKNSVEKKNQEKLINYPNPFSSSTTFSFILTTPSAVSLEVSDLLGRIVSTKDYGVLRSGNQQVVFDAKLITAGSYFYTLISGNNKSTGILQLIK